jgi:hypothetical protein
MLTFSSFGFSTYRGALRFSSVPYDRTYPVATARSFFLCGRTDLGPRDRDRVNFLVPLAAGSLEFPEIKLVRAHNINSPGAVKPKTLKTN